MMHSISSQDNDFRQAFERFEVPAADFDHKAHVRLAYIYLCNHPAEKAYESMRDALLSFLRHGGAPQSKYHETITRAWILAVKHFMEFSSPCMAAGEFIDQNPILLNSKIMLSHYSAELLFSTAARQQFVEPDIQPIPR